MKSRDPASLTADDSYLVWRRCWEIIERIRAGKLRAKDLPQLEKDLVLIARALGQWLAYTENLLRIAPHMREAHLKAYFKRSTSHAARAKYARQHEQMIAAWRTGKYRSKEQCAEKMHGKVGLSRKAARIALYNI